MPDSNIKSFVSNKTVKHLSVNELAALKSNKIPTKEDKNSNINQETIKDAMNAANSILRENGGIFL